MTDPASKRTIGRHPARRRWPPRLALVASMLATTMAACAKVAGIDGLTIGECKGGICLSDGGGADDAPSVLSESGSDLGVGDGDTDGGAPVDGSVLSCPVTHGPTMVRVGPSTNNFCIDSSEVTVAQYREFTVAKANDAGGQIAKCTWNTSYAAAVGGADDLPVAGIDWCDAYAFCAWAGKRLCGKHVAGKFAGSVATETDLGDFTTNEWLLACSSAGQLRYPYGGVEQPTACNTGENDAGRTLPVKSKTACQGGFPGLYDMVGNLWEWYDGPCPPLEAGAGAGTPAKDACLVKGGSYADPGPLIDCRVDSLGATRDIRALNVGVRCCAD